MLQKKIIAIPYYTKIMLKKAIAIPYYTIERKYWSGGLFLFFSKLGRKEFENEPK